MEENYQTLHDFVLDPSFCEWVLTQDEDASAYWQAYIKANPGKGDLVTQAKYLVLAMGKNEGPKLSVGEQAEVWSQIQKTIKAPKQDNIEYTESQRNHITPFGKEWIFRVAASLTAILMLSVAIYYKLIKGQEETIQFATSYGEVKRVFLPDSSEVVLNGNSALSYNKAWDTESSREVALAGEAFFKVTRQPNGQKFKVKLADNVSIEVLGTEFTAKRRPLDTKVVLNEGKVRFSVTDEGFLGFFKETVAQETLKPGELVALKSQNRTEAGLVKRQVQHPEFYSAFQYNKLMFADASLTEVARVLEEVYGFEVTFSDEGLMDRRYTGTVPHDKVEVLFIALEKLFNLKISQEGNCLEFSKTR